MASGSFFLGSAGGSSCEGLRWRQTLSEVVGRVFGRDAELEGSGVAGRQSEGAMNVESLLRAAEEAVGDVLR